MTDDITDTHCHIIDKTALNYPWLSDLPALDRDWPIETYQAEARSAGITRVLHMEVDVAENRIADETAYVDRLADAPDSLICGIIASCRPETPGFDEEVALASAHPRVKGFRRVLHVVPDDLSQSTTFRRNIKALAGANLPFDICVLARQLPIARDLVDSAPDTQFILDHCGVPDIAGGGWKNWTADITELARRDNVVVKISGLPAYAAADWITTDLESWIMHVVGAFGPKRCVWGGDWPVCTLGGGLSKWVSATRDILSTLSADERRAILNDNATRIWKL